MSKFMKLNLQLFACSVVTNTLTEISYDVASNTSQARYLVQIKTTGTSHNDYDITTTYYIDGAEYTSKHKLPANSTTTIIDKTVTIYHNTDGTKTVSASYSCPTGISAGTLKGSTSLKLTDIPRQANITSANDFSDEENPTINYSNLAGNAVNSLQACISWTGGADIAYRDISKTDTSYTFNLTEAERKALRSACTSNSMAVTFYVRTIIGENTFYSTLKKIFTIVNANPIFTDFSYSDSNELVSNITENNQILVANKSTLQVSIPSSNKMTAIKEATPSKYTFEIDGKNSSANYSTSPVSANLGTLSNSGVKRLNVRAFDSRNNSTLVYKDITVIPYSNPEIYITAERLNNFEEQTTISCKGKYSKVTIDNEDKNEILSILYRLKETNGEWSEWSDMTFILDAEKGEYACEDIYINLDNTKAFDIEVKVEDKFDSYVGYSIVDVGNPLFFISDNLQCIGVNCMPPENAKEGSIWFKGENGIIQEYFNRESLNVKGKMIRVGLSSVPSIGANTFTKLSFDAIVDNNFNNDFENYFKVQYGNIYVMNDNIKNVIVYGQVIHQPFNNSCYVYILKNDIALTASIGANSAPSTFMTIPVEKGDYISINVYFSNFDGTIDNWGQATYLQVTAI